MRGLFAIGPLVGLLAASAPAAAQPIADALSELKPSVNLRIVNLHPEPAADQAWPWQVLIAVPLISKKDGEKGSGMCGGSLIGERWILTAAHCFGDEDWDLDQSRSIAVAERRGTAKSKAFVDIDPESVHHIGKPIIHRQYHENTHENDIALLHLGEVAHSAAVPLLLVPNHGLESPPARAMVTGWGRVREIRQVGNGYVDVVTHQSVRPQDVEPDRLMQAELPLVATDQCSARNRDAGGVIDGRTLCAGFPQGGVDTCQGDSGGPMVMHTSRGRWVQIGVVSWGVGCARENRPGIYTRVSAFADWIRSNVGRDLAIVPDDQGQAANEMPQPDELKPNPQLDNAAGVTITFDKGDDVRVGNLVSYRVTTRKPGYLAIFDATPDGKLTQVFPNALSLGSPTGATPEAARVRPDRPLLVPDYRNQYRGFNVRITEPRGKGIMVAVLTDKPITSLDIPNGPKAFASSEEAIAALARLRDELRSRGLRPSDGGGAAPNWSVNVREYTVR
jgi:secreted trypsin-like serine protease